MLYIYIMLFIILILTILYNILLYHTCPEFANNEKIDLSNIQETIDVIVSGFYSDIYRDNFIELEKSFQKTNMGGKLSFYRVDQETMNNCFKTCRKFGVLNKFSGCSLKQRVISQIIHENIGKYVLYSEADVLFLKPIHKLIAYYAKHNYDIVFVTNRLIFNIGGPNTGVMLMKCTYLLADTIEQMCQEIESKCAWDEMYMIKGLINGKFKYTFFPLNYVSRFDSITPETMIVKFVGSKNKLQDQRKLSNQYFDT